MTLDSVREQYDAYRTALRAYEEASAVGDVIPLPAPNTTSFNVSHLYEEHEEAITEVLNEALREFHAAAVDVAAKLGGVTTPAAAIDRGLVDEWRALTDVTDVYRSIRSEQERLANACLPPGNSAFIRANLVHASRTLAGWRVLNGKGPASYPYDVTEEVSRGGQVFYVPVINSRFVLWLASLPFSALCAVSPSMLGTVDDGDDDDQ